MTISSWSFSSQLIFLNLQQNRAGEHQIKLRYSDRQTQVGENLVSYSRTPEAAMFWRMAPLHRVAVGESLQLAWAESAWGPGAWWPGMRGPARMAGMGRKGPDCAQTRVQCQAGKQTNQKKLRHVDTGTTLKRSESNGTNETDLRKNSRLIIGQHWTLWRIGFDPLKLLTQEKRENQTRLESKTSGSKPVLNNTSIGILPTIFQTIS